MSHSRILFHEAVNQPSFQFLIRFWEACGGVALHMTVDCIHPSSHKISHSGAGNGIADGYIIDIVKSVSEVLHGFDEAFGPRQHDILE